jgi:pseudouridine-5'-phosphate glycosidase
MNESPAWLKIAEPVQQRLAAGDPVVALESTVITHGLPKPINLDLAHQMEDQVRSVEVEPATIAVLRGYLRVGLSGEEIEELAMATDTHKISLRDMSTAIAKEQSGGTTVAATMSIASRVGIRLFATGGIGGIHRGESGDVSADLTELGRTPMAVICAGAKAILDLPRTLEWLETTGVPVIGWQTSEFPAFYSRESGLDVTSRVDSVAEIVELLNAHWELGFGGVLVCVACPEDSALPYVDVEAILEQALIEANKQEVYGKDLTPFLLRQMSELSSGLTQKANLALLRNNAYIAAQIAKALALSNSQGS